MSQDDISANAQDLINQVKEEIKEKEEKNISKQPSKNIIKVNTNDLEDPLGEKLIPKQNIVINKNIKRSDSISSSDSDSSNKDNSDDEKNDDSKKNSKINNKLKSSMASDNSNIENLMDKEDIYIKIAIIISGILTIMGAVLNMAMSLIGNKLTLTFGYSKNDNSLEELVMNHTMIYILLVVIIIFNVGLLVVVISGKDTSFGKLIYNELNWYFVLTQSALGFQFLITLIWEIDLWTINVCLSVSMLAILILAFYFTEIKKKTNMSVNTIIFIFIYISVLFSFIAYLTLFNISCILMENIEDENSEYKTTSSIVIKIAINALQTILSILLLTYYKDIFFAISSAYIESAIFIHLETDYKSGENITCLVFVCTIILGIILTIVSLKKKIFGIEGEKFQTN
jgi:hypothetical protein